MGAFSSEVAALQGSQTGEAHSKWNLNANVINVEKMVS